MYKIDLALNNAINAIKCHKTKTKLNQTKPNQTLDYWQFIAKAII